MSIISDDRRRVAERRMVDGETVTVQTLAAPVPTSLEVVVNGRLEVQNGRYTFAAPDQVAFDPPLDDGDVVFFTYLPASTR